MQKDGIVRSLLRNYIKYLYLNVEHTLAAVFFGIILIGVSLYLKRKSKSRSNENSFAPYLDRSESGRVGKIERFSHYVVFFGIILIGVSLYLEWKSRSYLNSLPPSLYRSESRRVGKIQRYVVFFGIILIGVSLYLKRKSKSRPNENSLAPYLDRSESGRVGKIERFSHYVARQLGFKYEIECPELMKLAYEYLKRSKECDEKMYEYLGKEANAEELYVKLVEEFERCILGYFSFHWRQTPLMISLQVSPSGVHMGTRYGTFSTSVDCRRFEKISEDLKLTRISTLVEEMKVIGTTTNKELNQSKPVALSERSPVLLLIGGGMGSGKSIVLKDIMKESFWSGAIADAVVVEADAFKETDAIYGARSSGGHHQGMLQTDELVQQSSTGAASKLLVTALNEGRDVIMDGTLSWIPFFEQTICMTRKIHKHRYRMGGGYQFSEDGTVTENYWEQIEGEEDKTRKPYRIELVGFVCDAYLAVVRGIRRAIQMDGAVKVKSLLKSHKRFASAFPRYYQLVDNVRLYCTNAPSGPPRLIAWKDGDSKLLFDPDEMKCFDSISGLNDDAETIYKLYKESDYITRSGSVWKDIVLLPKRGSLQLELKNAIQRIEVHIS